MNNLTFEYALQSPCGQFYNGCAHSDMSKNLTDIPMDTYTYSKHGAYTKKAAFPCFNTFLVVKPNSTIHSERSSGH